MVNALRGIHEPERTVVSVFTTPQVTGYFDASGAPNQGLLLVVAGFISFEQRWLQLECEWSKALAKEHVKLFHMTDFVFGKQRKGAKPNEFAGWGEGRRKAFITTLGKIVAASVIKSFASYVVLEDWREANRQYKLAEYDYHPYVIASWSCVRRVQDWCKDRAYDKTRPMFVFEHGDKHQPNMIKRVEKDLGVIVQTEKKDALTELQTADFAAWQLFNMMREHEQGNLPQYTVEPWLWQALSRLFLSVKYDHDHFSLTSHPMKGRTGDWRELQILREPSLIRFAKEQGVPKR
jgi:hypothetical protein